VEYRKLGDTDIDVSVICLGTMTWGEQNTMEEGHEQMDYALDMGVNFFDAAELYPIPPKAETQGKTEECIGTWFKKTGNREKIILATKVAGRSPMNWFRGEGTKLDRENIETAVDASLDRLQTDYIDLYQTHIFDPYTNQEETLRALDDLVSEGKIRYIGCSNYMAWELIEGIQISRRYGWSEFMTIQPEFSMFEREPESELIYACEKYKVGILPYFPLASGFLTGKYKKDSIPEGGRLSSGNTAWSEKWLTEENFTIIENLEKWAQNKGITMVQLAFSWLLAKKSVSSVIAGATSKDQIDSNITASGIEISNSELKEINSILPPRNEAGVGNVPRRIQNTP